MCLLTLINMQISGTLIFITFKFNIKQKRRIIMSTKFLSKAILYLLVFTVASTSLYGCAKKQESISSDSSSISTEIPSVKFPIVQEKITLKLMVTKWTNHGAYDEMAFTKAYEALTNIHIDWIECASAEGSTAKNLAFQSGDMPDGMFLINSTVTDQDVYTYSQQGLIADLGSLIEQYAPNIKKTFYGRTDALAAMTASDGKIYTLPYLADPTQINEQSIWFIRKSWLENLNLEMPKTTEDFYKVLTSFKNDDPNGNGLKDEIPFVIPGLHYTLWNPWGIDSWWGKNNMAVNAEGKLHYFPITDSFKNALSYYNKLWSEGLLEKNSVLGSSRTSKKLINQGLVGCMIESWPPSYLEENLCNDYVPMPIPNSMYKAEFSGNAAICSVNGASKHTFLVSEKSKYKAELMKWLDYLYTKEGQILVNYGPADDGYYNYNAEGKVNILDKKVDKFKTRGPGWVLVSPGTSTLGDAMAKTEETNLTWSELWYKRISQENLKKIYGTQINPFTLSDLFFTPEETAVITEHADAIGNTFYYSNEFILGIQSLDTQWSVFVEDAISKGVKDVTTVYQTAFDRAKK